MKHINKDFIGWFTFPTLYKDIVDRFPTGSRMVEVGVYEGKSFAYLIVEMINANKEFELWCVDSFTFPTEKHKYLGGLLDTFKENMKPVEDKFKTIIGDSSQSANQFEDGSLDFVFLDADHVYSNVKKDILAWLPKIKKGGILAGHDYKDFHPGVIQAVNEVFGEGNFSKKYIDELDEWCWMKEVL